MDDNPSVPLTPTTTTHWSGIPIDVTPDPVPQPPPPQPVPAKMKESGGATLLPNAEQVAKEEGDEYWESYAREIELEKEIAEIGGVEKVASGEVIIPEEVAKEIGVKPVVTQDTPIAKVVKDFTIRGVALTDEQLGTGLTKPTSSGFRWLVEWFIYQLLKAHFLVKRVKGKVLRGKPPS